MSDSQMTLLPCPFCGGAAKLKVTAFSRPAQRWVECSDCGGSSSAYVSAESAQAAWNSRKEERAHFDAGFQAALRERRNP